MTTQDFMWLALGLASLLIAGGALYAFIRLGLLLERTTVTLDKVDAKLDKLDGPVMQTMEHVSGIAGSVDDLAARVNRISTIAERAAGAVDKAADAAQSGITPTVVKLAGIAAAISAGTKAFFTKSKGNGAS